MIKVPPYLGETPMIAVPSVAIPLLLGFLSQGNRPLLNSLIVTAAGCFIISVLVLLHSCFLSEDAIDNLTDGKIEESQKLNRTIKNRNKFAYWITVLGFIFTFISAILIVTQHTYKNLEKIPMSTNDKNISSDALKMYLQGGHSLPKDCYPTTSSASQKGIPIPQSCFSDEIATPQATSSGNNSQPQSSGEANQDVTSRQPTNKS